MRIAYLAHNLDDPAVSRRVRMLQIGGADVRVAGFRRGSGELAPIDGVIPSAIGQTQDSRLIRRIFSVATVRLPAGFLDGADVILARNLEMLAIAMRYRRSRDRDLPVVYECLDIHRLLTGHGWAGRLLRRLEGRLGRSASLLITSSPAFILEYFERRSQVSLPTLLVENKVLEPDPVADDPHAPPPGPPWRIGWFGAIRCSRSLSILGALATALEGKVEVVIRGRPAYSEFVDFHAEVAQYRHVTFLGPYESSDLAAIYADVHFAWAIDFFEHGLNSTWLRPNRVYESARHGAVPIAQGSVETGHFLKEMGIGVLLGDDLENDLRSYFENLSEAGYMGERSKVAACRRTSWTYGAADCRRLVGFLADVAGGRRLESATL